MEGNKIEAFFHVFVFGRYFYKKKKKECRDVLAGELELINRLLFYISYFYLFVCLFTLFMFRLQILQQVFTFNR
jgi:hypothetical protein